MNIEQIEHLIQEADAAGKKTLVLGYLFISVKKTLEMKARWEFHVMEACKRLAKYRTEPECSISEFYIGQHAMRAGSCFCTYLGNLGLLIRLGDNPPIPAEISAEAELQRQWTIGFNVSKAQMYKDPD